MDWLEDKLEHDVNCEQYCGKELTYCAMLKKCKNLCEATKKGNRKGNHYAEEIRFLGKVGISRTDHHILLNQGYGIMTTRKNFL